MNLNIYCIGVNYKKVSIEIRERYSVFAQMQGELLQILKNGCGVNGAVILSTCNRSELYFSGDSDSLLKAEKAFAAFCKIPKETFLNHIYVYAGEKAMRHLFAAACGLDSMILGEDEILRQVKEAYGYSLRRNMTCYVLNTAFQGAIHCAKCIKTKTRLSKTAVSFGTLAANQIEAFTKETGNSRVLLVGITGKIGQILAKNLCSKGIRQIVGTSRTHSKTVTEPFAEMNIPIIDFADRYQYIDDADVIVSATLSPHYTFTRERVGASLRMKKERLFVDMAVPRDMDVDIAKLSGCRIIDIDDFKKTAAQNNEIKLQETERAMLILTEKLDETLKNIYVSEYIDKNETDFTYLKERTFETIFYRLKREMTGEQFLALIEAMEKISIKN